MRNICVYCGDKATRVCPDPIDEDREFLHICNDSDCWFKYVIYVTEEIEGC